MCLNRWHKNKYITNLCAKTCTPNKDQDLKGQHYVLKLDGTKTNRIHEENKIYGTFWHITCTPNEDVLFFYREGFMTAQLLQEQQIYEIFVVMCSDCFLFVCILQERTSHIWQTQPSGCFSILPTKSLVSHTSLIFNRPSVAEAVLQSPPFLIY